MIMGGGGGRNGEQIKKMSRPPPAPLKKNDGLAPGPIQSDGHGHGHGHGANTGKSCPRCCPGVVDHHYPITLHQYCGMRIYYVVGWDGMGLVGHWLGYYIPGVEFYHDLI